MEGLMLTLKLQYFHLMQRADSSEKTLMLGKIEGRRRRADRDKMVGWHHRVNGLEFGNVREMVKDREAWRAAVHGVTKSRTRLSEQTAASVPGRQLLPTVVRPL